jgi:acetyl-CoA C-acetyltransferase
MRRYLHESGHDADDCSLVVTRNRANARANSRASFAEPPAESRLLFDPLTSDQVAASADGCIVVVLADEGVTRARGAKVWVDGVGWNQDSPSLESRVWGRAGYVARAADMAYRQAGLRPDAVDAAEVDDTYAYKQLQHLDALGLGERGTDLSVNRTGGSIGEGYLHEANGLARFLGCTEAVRDGEASVALAQSWRGVPSASAAVAILKADS